MRRSLAILGTRGIPARYGGFETFADVIGRRLVKAGHRVIVTCERPAHATGATAPPTEYEGVELLHVAAPRLGPLSTIVHDMLCLWRLRRTTDVVYLLGYGAALFAFIPRLYGKEVWINPDGVEWKRGKWNAAARFWFRCMEWITMRIATRVVADSQALADLLRERHGTRRPTSVIAYGTEVPDVQPKGDFLAQHGLESGRYFLVICRFEPENHLLEILRGYLRAGVDVPLVLFGDHRRPTAYVRALLEAAGDAQNIHFLGVEFDQERITAWRSHCLAYVHGHSVGGTNPSLLEALGAGSPVMAHDNAFNREVLGDLQAEWFQDEASAARAYNNLCELDRYALASRCHDARARACAHYSWNSIADQYLELLGSSAVTHPPVQPATATPGAPTQPEQVRTIPAPEPQPAPLDQTSGT